MERAAPLAKRVPEHAHAVRALRRRIPPGTDRTLEGAVERADAAEALIGGRALEVNAEAVLHLAHRSGCSPYDCESLQLAKDRETQLLTYGTPVLEAFLGVAMRARTGSPPARNPSTCRPRKAAVDSRGAG